jgi:hypothetical protein
MEKIGKDKESKTEKRNQRELLWLQTGGVLNFITAAPHCGDIASLNFRMGEYSYLYLLILCQETLAATDYDTSPNPRMAHILT